MQTTEQKLVRKRRPHLVEGPRLVINTGLSVVAEGHLISLERDKAHRVAAVRVARLDPKDERCGAAVRDARASTMPMSIADAAELLAKRAERFLGMAWRVERWRPQAGNDGYPNAPEGVPRG